ncbi:hypothetical protein AcV5_002986 [Taiwanofungus camphoratus]|nr:hypothetical protein AcV5_002986 [Antrodia cinnamomea]KAI0954212.1 hypothetical protein AcV7_007506 [Antrodia cinnamomea]
MQNFLIHHYRYKPDDVVLLVDDSPEPRHRPTRANILEAMHWLVRNAHPHDSLFFHYSGHGGQTRDRDGDEVDGYDEVIYPVDYRQSGFIVDDLMHTVMVKSLPAGCRLTALFDSCHSGSVLDLPYLVSAQKQHSCLPVSKVPFCKYHTDGRVKSSQVTPSHITEKSTFADVVSWSGCKDAGTSADTWERGTGAVGAMSYAFMSSLSHNPNQSYQELLKSVRDILRTHYKQKPQLSSSHRIDTNLKFIM